MIDQKTLVLASGSVYRQRLLSRLSLSFECDAPDIEESRLEDEDAREMARRLAREKGAVVATRWPQAVVLSSDQTASLGDLVLNKPGNRETALAQLRGCSGRSVDFYTAVALTINGSLHAEALVHTAVGFRALSEDELTTYIDIDNPFDCAGSFRWEGIGICLFESLRSEDPTALEGLPLIRVADMLRSVGINPLQSDPQS
ncbi:MAG: nucleoside triphosphate pyrophosphatase [Pseudomonadota bacterium]